MASSPSWQPAALMTPSPHEAGGHSGGRDAGFDARFWASGCDVGGGCGIRTRHPLLAKHGVGGIGAILTLLEAKNLVSK